MRWGADEVQFQAPDVQTVSAVPPGELLGRAHGVEALAQAELLHWGPAVATASILLGVGLGLVGALAGWRGLRRTGLAVGLSGPVGYVVAVIVLRTLLGIS